MPTTRTRRKRGRRFDELPFQALLRRRGPAVTYAELVAANGESEDFGTELWFIECALQGHPIGGEYAGLRAALAIWSLPAVCRTLVAHGTELQDRLRERHIHLPPDVLEALPQEAS